MSVSVIIPTYNRAHLVCAAIESVLAQKIKDVQVIVVDDGSSDNTRHMLERYGERVTCLYQENQGAGPARNNGIAHAVHPLIAFLDSDDLWLDFKLPLQLAVMEKHPDIALLCSSFFILKEDGRKIPSGLNTWLETSLTWEQIYGQPLDIEDKTIQEVGRYKKLDLYKGCIYSALLDNLVVLTSSAVVRRDAILPGIEFPRDLSIYEDWEFFARIAKVGTVGYLDVETVLNRGHDDGVRLTAGGPRLHALSRVALVEKIWASDAEFLVDNGCKVDRVLARQHLLLARFCLYESDPRGARHHLEQFRHYKSPGPDLGYFILKVLAYIPGGSLILTLLRLVRGVLKGPLTARSA